MYSFARVLNLQACRCSRTVIEQRCGAKWWSFKDEEPERRPLHDPNAKEQSGKSRSYVQGEDGHLATHTINMLKDQNILTTKKGYHPPSDVELIVQEVVENVCEQDVSDWKTVSLTDRKQKFKILTKLMTKLDHSIPSVTLDSLNNGLDVLTYFQTEVRVSTALEDLSTMELPPNLSIRTEYNKFDPSPDSFFKGQTAYPGRDTHVTSLKNSRKYKTIRTKVQKPGYLDHYYDY